MGDELDYLEGIGPASIFQSKEDLRPAHLIDKAIESIMYDLDHPCPSCGMVGCYGGCYFKERPRPCANPRCVRNGEDHPDRCITTRPALISSPPRRDLCSIIASPFWAISRLLLPGTSVSAASLD